MGTRRVAQSGIAIRASSGNGSIACAPACDKRQKLHERRKIVRGPYSAAFRDEARRRLILSRRTEAHPVYANRAPLGPCAASMRSNAGRDSNEGDCSRRNSIRRRIHATRVSIHAKAADAATKKPMLSRACRRKRRASESSSYAANRYARPSAGSART
jgi:hypothetical protein